MRGTRGAKGARGARDKRDVRQVQWVQGGYEAGTRGVIGVQIRYKWFKVGKRQVQGMQGKQIVIGWLQMRGCLHL